MKRAYDFAGGRRARPEDTAGKSRITIRLDDDVLEWFRERSCGWRPQQAQLRGDEDGEQKQVEPPRSDRVGQDLSRGHRIQEDARRRRTSRGGSR